MLSHDENELLTKTGPGTPMGALLRRYCTWVYARTGSYSETARRLGLDPRTVRDRVDAAWLAALRDGNGGVGRNGSAAVDAR